MYMIGGGRHYHDVHTELRYKNVEQDIHTA
jgi:hypothetical protein